MGWFLLFYFTGVSAVLTAGRLFGGYVGARFVVVTVLFPPTPCHHTLFVERGVFLGGAFQTSDVFCEVSRCCIYSDAIVLAVVGDMKGEMRRRPN